MGRIGLEPHWTDVPHDKGDGGRFEKASLKKGCVTKKRHN